MSTQDGLGRQDVDLEYAERSKANNGSNLAFFALQNRSVAAREPLALAASNGQLGMRELALVLELVRDGASRRLAVEVIRSFRPKSTLTLARLIAAQNLLPTDRDTATVLFDLAVEAFGPKALAQPDRLHFLELLAEAGHEAEFKSALRRIPLPDSARHHGSLLAANLTNPWTQTPGNRGSARRLWHSLVAGVFAADSAEPISVLTESGSAIDSIACAAETTVGGPLVTILVPTRNAGRRLTTAMAGLLAQSWRDLEIILIDDGSDRAYRPYIDVWADRDDRVRVVRLAKRVGTYAARNIGAREAQGQLITVHDDDDWSHPRKIEIQAKALLADPGSVGNMSQWVRTTEDLTFLRINGNPNLIQPNYSSFMFRRAPVFEALGYWDEVNRAADSEFRNRVVAWAGNKPAIVGSAPMSLGRVRSDSLTAGELRHGYVDPRRRWYELSSSGWHLDATEQNQPPRLAVNARRRPFGAPDSMLSAAQRAEHVDVMYATDFRFPGGNSTLSANELSILLDEGLTIGLLQMDSPILTVTRELHPRIREIANNPKCHIYSTLDDVDVDLLIIRHPTVLQYAGVEAARISAKCSCLIVNHTPRLSDGSGVHYDLPTCVENGAAIFGTIPIVVPESGVIRNRIAEVVPGLELASFDWPGCLRLRGGTVRSAQPGRRPVIGRHSRDGTEKWPESLEELINAYPVDGSRDVRVLGGASTPASRHTEELIAAWTVYPYGSRNASEFLSEVDFWVYFHADTLIESFGMAIAEAMASGVVVILPEYMRATFGEGALYSKPADVQGLIDYYWHEQPERYREQSERGIEVATTRFSPSALLSRVRRLVGLADFEYSSEKREPNGSSDVAPNPPRTIEQQAIQAIRSAEVSSRPAMLLAYHPVYSRNPYQTLIYRRFAETGIGVVPLHDPANTLPLTSLTQFGAPAILHLHWTHWILSGAETNEEAEYRVDRAADWLTELRASGIRIVWTIHNVLPHETVFPGAESRLQQCIVDNADVVHIMNANTLLAVSSVMDVPADKALLVPHPNYIGAYPDYQSKPQARAILGIDPDEIVYVMIGALRPYKGLGKLIPALGGLDMDRPRRLVVAGKPDSSASTQAFLEKCAQHPRVLIDDRVLPGRELQTYLRAADIAIAPYERTLNSGFVLLALSFGLPVVAPASGSLAEFLTPDSAEVYDPSAPDGFALALRRADRLLGADAAAAARGLAEQFDSDTLSRSLAEELRGRLLPPQDARLRLTGPEAAGWGASDPDPRIGIQHRVA